MEGELTIAGNAAVALQDGGWIEDALLLLLLLLLLLCFFLRMCPTGC